MSDTDKPKAPDEEVWVPAPLDYMAKERSRRIVRAAATSRAKTREGIKADMISLIQSRYEQVEPAAVRLADLNRRFGMACVRLGFTARDVVLDLIEEGLIEANLINNESVIVWDKLAHDKAMVIFDTMPGGREAIEHAIFRRAFPSKDMTVKENSTAREKRRFPWE